MVRNAHLADEIFTLRWRISVCVTVLTCCFPTSLSAQPQSPEQTLTQEFSLLRNGQVWINRDEQRLLYHLDSLPGRRARILEAENSLSHALERNEAAWRQYAAVQQRIQQLERGRAASANGAQRKIVERELKRQREAAAHLKQQAIEPAEFAGIPAVRNQLVTLSNHRTTLLLSLLRIRATVADLERQYGELQENHRVTTALKDLGDRQKLGPLRNYGDRLKQLAPYEKLVFTSQVPLYRLGDRLRVSLIVGDDTPATFTWRESHEPTILTASVAEAAGIAATPSARRNRVTVAGNRHIQVRELVIPYLRLGRHVVKNVPALLLPPDAEDVGSQIGPTALPGYDVVADPARCHLRVLPAAGG